MVLEYIERVGAAHRQGGLIVTTMVIAVIDKDGETKEVSRKLMNMRYRRGTSMLEGEVRYDGMVYNVRQEEGWTLDLRLYTDYPIQPYEGIPYDVQTMGVANAGDAAEEAHDCSLEDICVLNIENVLNHERDEPVSPEMEAILEMCRHAKSQGLDHLVVNLY